MSEKKRKSSFISIGWFWPLFSHFPKKSKLQKISWDFWERCGVIQVFWRTQTDVFDKTYEPDSKKNVLLTFCWLLKKWVRKPRLFEITCGFYGLKLALEVKKLLFREHFFESQQKVNKRLFWQSLLNKRSKGPSWSPWDTSITFQPPRGTQLIFWSLDFLGKCEKMVKISLYWWTNFFTFSHLSLPKKLLPNSQNIQ